METIVGATRGTNKFESFSELLRITKFDENIQDTFIRSNKNKSNFKVAIKANMMVFVRQEGHTATVTDKELVEYFVDHLILMGFTNISVCDAQHDVGQLLKNHNVSFISKQIGYNPDGRYKIVDLTTEKKRYKYIYKCKSGKIRKWKDSVGITWRDADFRISFAKCKTHEHDWMTLSVKNIYGCFPNPNKIRKYHMQKEVSIVTSRSIKNFPVHFSFVDGWISSDGFQGYKIPNPKETKILFGGENAIAVDMEIFKRAGLDYKKSRILEESVYQLYDDIYPIYRVVGDTTNFSDICEWENISDVTVNFINFIEEIYVAWGFINIKPSSIVDYKLFPPKSFFSVSLVWFSKKLYDFLIRFRFYKKLYDDK